MKMYDIIAKKRDNHKLTKEEISFFIKGYDDESIPDYQASAFLMAVFLNGLDDEETAWLTDEMAHSGDMLDLSEFKNTVDKHSTGGVGDKTTLIVAPIVAAAGCTVAKMSGRGLGHTGGTVDKLESIKGYRTDLNENEFKNLIKETGVAVIGQSASLTPADKKIYALRDVTATVESIPLIASSIMSKKLAAGAKNIVLDVKFGNGAFMKTKEDACVLARKMINIGRHCNRNVAAVISDMNSPLGYNIGNSLEVIEAVRVLKGEEKGELYEVSIALSAQMISLSLNIEPETAQKTAEDIIKSGKAYEKMKEWLSAQGADISFIEDTNKFKKAKYKKEIISLSDGFVFGFNTEALGKAAGALGAGRKIKTDKIDMSAGIVLNIKKGQIVKKGEVLCTLLTDNESLLSKASEIAEKAIIISADRPDITPHIYKILR